MSDEKATLAKTDRELIEFVNQFSCLLGEQLEGMRTDLANAFDEVMTRLMEIDQSQSKAKEMAEAWLKGKYLAPSKEDNEAMNERQKAVDAIVENRNGDKLSSTVSLTDNAGIAELHEIDQELSRAIVNLVGALSADDVSRQKLQHIETVVKKTKSLLDELIRTPVKNYDASQIGHFKAELLQTAATVYSTTTETQIFSKYFPNVTKKSA